MDSYAHSNQGTTVEDGGGGTMRVKLHVWDSDGWLLRLTLTSPDGDEQSAIVTPGKAFRFALAILHHVFITGAAGD